MSIVLSGGGDNLKNIKLLNIFKDKLSGTRILLIPRAIENKKYYKYEKWLSDIFPIKEYKIFILDEGNIKNYDYNFFTNFDGIFIGGGNTFKLQNTILKYNFYSVIKSYVSNKAYYGSSAGSVIIMRDIEVAIGEDENLFNLQGEQLLGLNHLDGLNLFCHFEKSKIDHYESFTTTHLGKYLGIGEGEGLIIDKDMSYFIGSEIIYIIENGKSVTYSNENFMSTLELRNRT